MGFRPLKKEIRMVSFIKKLGVVYKDGKIINHRSLIKVLLNPIISKLGFCIATKYDLETNKLGNPILIKSGSHSFGNSLLFKVPVDYYDVIKKERRFI